MRWGYPLVEIGDLVISVKKWNPRQNKSNELINYIDISSVNRETKKVEDVIKVFTHEAPSRARQLVMKGDVLVSTVRPNLNAVAHLETELDRATASTGFTVLRPDSKKICDRYLYYWVRSPYFVQDMVRRSTGASYPAVTDSIVKAYNIPLPSLEEQKRIAAILDKAETIRRKRKEAIALTEELLRSTFLDMFGDPVTNPKGWKVMAMSDVVSQIEAGWSAKAEERQCNLDEWGVLKISAVTSGVFNPNEHKAIDNPTFKKKPIIPKKGDLLFSRANTRELVAATCLVESDCERLFLPDKLWRIQTNPNVANVEYLRFLLADPKYRSLLARKATGTSGSMLNVSQAKLLSMDAPVPDINIQVKFANILWRIYKLKERTEKSFNTLNRNFNSLLQKAFRGEL